MQLYFKTYIRDFFVEILKSVDGFDFLWVDVAKVYKN